MSWAVFSVYRLSGWRLFAILCVTVFIAGDVLAAAQPNIVFILSDDVAQGDLGCYGQKLIRTPHLDRMAAEGTRYTQAYAGTSVCAPSRSVLITGLHTGHCPVRGNYEIMPGEGQLPLPAETVTVAQLLQRQGYATGCFGKWGMGMFDTTGSPLKKGFGRFYGYNCQRHAHHYFPSFLYDNDKRFQLPGNRPPKRQTTYSQDLIQDSALAWVRENHERPFFLFYAITLPHGRHEIDDQGDYRDKPWSEKEKNYAAMVSRLDSDVGGLLALLEELGIDDNTLVVFSGDNGSSFKPKSDIGRRFDQTMGGTLRGSKNTLYEGGLRQAALARWPTVVPAGRVTDEPWAFWDFLPTAVEIAGGELPGDDVADGLSLVSFLKGGSAPSRECFYWELHNNPAWPGGFPNPLQAVRFGDWKAVRNGAGTPLELYDLSVDGAESHDLAADRPDLVAKAERLLAASRVPDPNWGAPGVDPE
ncbi:MAG: arylsulfatase [Planctomycetota bacterium]